MPNTRAANANGWDTDWTTADAAAMNAWTGRTNATTTKVRAWWQLTAGFANATAAWHAAWAANSLNGAVKMAVGGFASEEAGNGTLICNTAAGSGTWITNLANSSLATVDQAGCLKYCEEFTRSGMLMNP